ncbi:MAG: DUF6783 domain-containing protein [Clostridiales bacterium]|nr:DUF6783 domain-containing protein [Clostridiales bacterium]
MSVHVSDRNLAHSGYIARYAPIIRGKSPANRNAQLSESNFQTRPGKSITKIPS